jgi:hypothetical protein
VNVKAGGTLRLLGTLPAVAGSKCVATNGQGNVYVCAPNNGSVLFVKDNLADAPDGGGPDAGMDAPADG